MSFPTMTIRNSAGRAFTVIIGDRNHFRPHPSDLPGENIVAFYDATRAGDAAYPTFQPHGQFVADYYASTLLAEWHTGVPISTGGLDLMGHEPLWKIDTAAMNVVRAWLRLLIVRMP